MKQIPVLNIIYNNTTPYTTWNGDIKDQPENIVCNELVTNQCLFRL